MNYRGGNGVAMGNAPLATAKAAGPQCGVHQSCSTSRWWSS